MDDTVYTPQSIFVKECYWNSGGWEIEYQLVF
jgi:hypothetical protein